jgi:hypothetical protein
MKPPIPTTSRSTNSLPPPTIINSLPPPTIMKLVLDQLPQLGDFGFGVYDARTKTPAERNAELQHQREQIKEPRSIAQFLAARRWLQQFRKLKSLNKRGSSYGLKHRAEHSIGYITNGVFIAAACAEGFQVVRIENGPNAWLNISSEAWKRRK